VTLVRSLNGKHTYVIYCFPNDLVKNPSLTRVSIRSCLNSIDYVYFVSTHAGSIAY